MATQAFDFHEQLLKGVGPEDSVEMPGPASRADLVILSREYGVLPIVRVGTSLSADDEIRLGAATAYFREVLGDLGAKRVRGLFLADGVEQSSLPTRAARLSITSETLASGAWAKSLVPNPPEIPDGDLDKIRAIIAPAATVITTREFVDDRIPENERRRITLDAEQLATAMLPPCEVLHVAGGAGSGKTVILIARAQWFAAEHPDWRILLLCYNEALRISLEAQLTHLPNVEIHTFRTAARRFDVSITEFGDDAPAHNQRAIDRAMATRKGADSWDAVLVDEGQDFGLLWLRFIQSWIQAGRGGLTITSDPCQGLYGLVGNDSAAEFTREQQTNSSESVNLTGSYRTTSQILRAAVLASGARHPGLGASLDGSNVQLIWAPSPKEQSACIAWEIRNLMQTKQVERYSDVGILFTNRYVLDNNPFENHLTRALRAESVPFVVRAMKGKLAPLTGDEVTITTVHSAKGKEFAAVFVIGTEALKTGEEPEASNFRGVTPKRETLDSRAAYVAFTRARNILMLTYTKPNSVIEHLQAYDFVDKCQWPLDYKDRG